MVSAWAVGMSCFKRHTIDFDAAKRAPANLLDVFRSTHGENLRISHFGRGIARSLLCPGLEF